MSIITQKQLVSYEGTWSNSTEYNVINVSDITDVGNMYLSCPSVKYNSVLYVAKNINSQPELGTTPDTYSAWESIATSESDADVLNTELAGYSFSSGIVSDTDNILQALNKIGDVAETILTAYTPTSGTISPASTIISAFNNLGYFANQFTIESPSNTQILIYNPVDGFKNVSLSGAITVSALGVSTIENNVVTNSNLAQMATLTIKGNTSGGNADPADLTVGQVQTMLNPMASNEISADTTLTTNDNIKVNLITGTTVVVTMPATPVTGTRYMIKNGTNSTTNSVSGNSKNIDGNSTISLTAYQSATLYYDGTQYWIVSV